MMLLINDRQDNNLCNNEWHLQFKNDRRIIRQELLIPGIVENEWLASPHVWWGKSYINTPFNNRYSIVCEDRVCAKTNIKLKL